MKQVLFSLALFFAVGMPATYTAAAADADAITKTLDETEERLDAIVNTGFVWRWTYDRIADAREALAAGDTAAAEELLARAVRETDLAEEQIAKAETNWAIAVPK